MFHVSLLEQNTTKKGRVDENVGQMESDAGNSEEYEVETIRESAVYARELESGQLPGLYYLVSWKRYPQEENTWEPASAVQHFRKLIRSFHKDHPDKPTATFEAIDTALPMASPIIKPAAKTATRQPKQKRGQPANSTNKRTKKSWAEFDFYRVFGVFLTFGYPTSLAWLSRDLAPTLQNFYFSILSLIFQLTQYLISSKPQL